MIIEVLAKNIQLHSKLLKQYFEEAGCNLYFVPVEE